MFGGFRISGRRWSNLIASSRLLSALAFYFSAWGALFSWGSTAQAQSYLAPTPWPMYRYSEGHIGRSPHRGPRSPDLKWAFSTGKKEAEGGFETDVTIGPDGSLLIGSNNGIFYAIDPDDGSIKWVYITEFDRFAIYSTAAVDKNSLIYFGAKDGYLYALRPPNKGIRAEVAWKFKIGTTIETSPLIGPDGTIYIGADDWKLYAVAPPGAGGQPELKWTFQTGGSLISNPALGPDGTILFGSMDGSLYALKPAAGGEAPKLKWKFSTGGRDAKGGIETTPVVAETGDVYIGANNGLFYALDGGTGSPKWSVRTFFTEYAIFSSPALGRDGLLYFGPKDGRLLAVSPPASGGKEGKIKWAFKIGTTIETSPALGADGIVYIGADNGKLYAVAPPDGRGEPKLLWSFQTGGTLISSPVIGADGSLYQPSMDGKLYAFGQKKVKAEKGPGAQQLSGTWYGRYRAGAPEVKIRAVAVQKGNEIATTFHLENGLRSEFQAKLSGDIIEFSTSIKTKNCDGIFSGKAKVVEGKVEGNFAVDGCAGGKLEGSFALAKQ